MMRTGQKAAALQRAGLVIAMVAVCGVAAPTFADPPAHAPAHGWRKKHDPQYVGYTGHEWSRDYGIIEGRCNRDEVGMVLGGIVGGAIGSQVGDGSGRAVAIVLGAVLGAVVGREIGRDMDDRDRACVGHALELARDGQSVRWQNRETGINYVVTPTNAFRSNGDQCRAFRLESSAGSRSRKTETGACLASEGTWKFMS
jgi:surface antigen